MFDNKQIQNIRNAFYKYVDSGEERSQIVQYAEALAEDEVGAERDAIYWSTIWYCSQPKNRDKFREMYKELKAGQVLGIPEESTEPAKTKAPRNRKGSK